MLYTNILLGLILLILIGIAIGLNARWLRRALRQFHVEITCGFNSFFLKTTRVFRSKAFIYSVIFVSIVSIPVALFLYKWDRRATVYKYKRQTAAWKKYNEKQKKRQKLVAEQSSLSSYTKCSFPLPGGSPQEQEKYEKCRKNIDARLKKITLKLNEVSSLKGGIYINEEINRWPMTFAEGPKNGGFALTDGPLIYVNSSQLWQRFG